MTTTTITTRALDPESIKSLLSTCLNPSMASRGSDKVARLAEKAEKRGEHRYAAKLYVLASCLNERRHCLREIRDRIMSRNSAHLVTYHRYLSELGCC